MSKPPALPEWLFNMLALNSYEARFDKMDGDGPAFQVMCVKCGNVEYRLLHPDHSTWPRERWIQSCEEHRLNHECSP